MPSLCLFICSVCLFFTFFVVWFGGFLGGWFWCHKTRTLTFIKKKPYCFTVNEWFYQFILILSLYLFPFCVFRIYACMFINLIRNSILYECVYFHWKLCIYGFVTIINRLFWFTLSIQTAFWFNISKALMLKLYRWVRIFLFFVFFLFCFVWICFKISGFNVILSVLLWFSFSAIYTILWHRFYVENVIFRKCSMLPWKSSRVRNNTKLLAWICVRVVKSMPCYFGCYNYHRLCVLIVWVNVCVYAYFSQTNHSNCFAFNQIALIHSD